VNSDKYIGMDVHQATTVVAVLDAEGKLVLETIVETQAAAIIRLLQSLSGKLRLTFEETTQAAWLYDMARHFVSEAVVCDPRRNKLLMEGSKGDKPDARKLAELLRAGLLRSVYHGHQGTRILKELVRVYETLSLDTERTMVRIKAVFRGHGIRTQGRAVYQASQREQWLEQLRDYPGARKRAEFLYEELDQLRPLRRKAKQSMLSESRSHRAVSLLRTIPQLGSGSRGNDCRHCRYSAPFPNQAAVLELQRTGGGDAHERGIRDQGGPRRTAAKADSDSGAEPQLQSAVEGDLHQRRRRLPERAVPRLCRGAR
jgi:hypothetical protein